MAKSNDSGKDNRFIPTSNSSLFHPSRFDRCKQEQKRKRKPIRRRIFTTQRTRTHSHASLRGNQANSQRARIPSAGSHTQHTHKRSPRHTFLRNLTKIIKKLVSDSNLICSTTCKTQILRRT